MGVTIWIIWKTRSLNKSHAQRMALIEAIRNYPIDSDSIPQIKGQIDDLQVLDAVSYQSHLREVEKGRDPRYLYPPKFVEKYGDVFK